jgi:hypothetical protein
MCIARREEKLDHDSDGSGKQELRVNFSFFSWLPGFLIEM